jgi:ABC-type cobalamin/Fe3+-siderophores transport system ATPase subunit
VFGCPNSTALPPPHRHRRGRSRRGADAGHGAHHVLGRGLRRLISSKEVARRLGLLPQSPVAPDAITVADLVARGVWLTMVLAQETPIVLLDEPTTFLDIAHQIEVLDLCAELHEERGHTLVAVLHDLNHACRYATHLIAMSDGQIVARGDPAQIVDAQLVERVFGLRCRVIEDPETGTPLIVPAGRGARAQYPSRTTFSSGSPAA